MKYISLIALLLIYSLAALGSVNGRLVFYDEKIAVGDTVPATIEFPIQGLDNNFHDEDFLHKKINESFYITEVKDHHISENNHDMYVVNVLVSVIRSYIPGHEQVLQVGHLDLRLNTSDAVQLVKFSEKLPKDLIFIDSLYKLPLDQRIKKLIEISLILLILGISNWFYKKRAKLKKIELAKQKFQQRLGQWKKNFEQANTRSDFETIFAELDQWKDLLKNDSLLADYRTSVQQYIYKKTIDQSDQTELQKIHSNLAKDFKNGI